MRLRSFTFAVLILLLLGSASRLSFADKAKSVRIYDEGKTEYNLGNFEKAIVLFKAAYKEFKAPAYLYNIAQSYRQQGNCEALFFYERYLAEQPDSKQRESIDAYIAELQTRCDSQPTQSPPVDAQVDTPEASVQAPTVGAAEPPSLTSEVQDAVNAHIGAAQQYHSVGQFSLAALEYEKAYQVSHDSRYIFHKAEALRLAGQSVEAMSAYDLYLVIAPDGLDAPLARQRRDQLGIVAHKTPADSGHWTAQKKWALGVGAVGLVGVGVGSFFGLRALGQRNDALDADIGGCDSDFEGCNAEGIRLYVDAQDSASLANLGIGLGVAASATAIVLWLTSSSPKDDSPQAVQVLPQVDARAVGFVLQGAY